MANNKSKKGSATKGGKEAIDVQKTPLVCQRFQNYLLKNATCLPNFSKICTKRRQLFAKLLKTIC